MDFRIVGADRHTGEDATTRIAAADEAAAAAIARLQGILVESVIPITPHSADPAPPLQGSWRKYRSTGTGSAYQPIIDGARLLNIAGGITLGLGVTALIGTVCAVIAAVHAYATLDPSYIDLKAASALGAVVGISLLLVSTIVRMIGAVGLAVRDIAINTAKPNAEGSGQPSNVGGVEG